MRAEPQIIKFKIPDRRIVLLNTGSDDSKQFFMASFKLNTYGLFHQ